MKFFAVCFFAISFALTLIFSEKIDLTITRFFYQISSPEPGTFFQSPITDFLYKYGDKIGIVIGVLAGFAYLLFFIFPKAKKWQPATLYLSLTLVIGAGLIVNSLFKELWARPRPKQVIEFGGKHEFRPFYSPYLQSREDPKKSFPSGHTAMGFYFITFCFIGKRYDKRWIFWFGCTLTFLLGFGLMLTRIMQGGHFFTDTLFGSLFMCATAFFLDKFLLKKLTSLEAAQKRDA